MYVLFFSCFTLRFIVTLQLTLIVLSSATALYIDKLLVTEEREAVLFPFFSFVNG